MTEQIMIKKRENWADYAKFIGIFSVIFSHVHDAPTSGNTVDIWLYSIHMPFFFLIAGYFVNTNKSTKSILKSSFRSLIVPYFCFYTIDFFANIVLSVLQEERILSLMESVVKPLIGMVLGIGDYTSISNNIYIPIWFLLALFWCRVLFQYVATIRKNTLLIIFLFNVLSLSISLVMRRSEIGLLLSLGPALLAMPFYTLGYLLNRYKALATISGWKAILLFFVLLLISVFGSLYNVKGGEYVDIRTLQFGDNLFLFYVLGTIGSLAIILLSKFFNEKECSLLLYFGKNTLIILGVHYWIYHYVYRIWLKYCFAINRELAMTSVDRLVLSVIILFLCFIPIYIINKYFPFMVGKTNPSKIKH